MPIGLTWFIPTLHNISAGLSTCVNIWKHSSNVPKLITLYLSVEHIQLTTNFQHFRTMITMSWVKKCNLYACARYLFTRQLIPSYFKKLITNLKKKVFLTHSAFARLSAFASFFICRRTLVLHVYVECEPIKTVQYKNFICRMRTHNTGTKQPLWHRSVHVIKQENCEY